MGCRVFGQVLHFPGGPAAANLRGLEPDLQGQQADALSSPAGAVPCAGLPGYAILRQRGCQRAGRQSAGCPLHTLPEWFDRGSMGGRAAALPIVEVAHRITELCVCTVAAPLADGNSSCGSQYRQANMQLFNKHTPSLANTYCTKNKTYKYSLYCIIQCIRP